MKTDNILDKQIKNEIRHIELEDLYAYTTGSKVVANISIHIKNGIKKYKLVRTKTGGYLMQ